MIAVQTGDVPLMEFGHAGDPATRFLAKPFGRTDLLDALAGF